MPDDTTLMAPDSCPVCKHCIDAATCVDGAAKPKAGDLTVCLYCRSFLAFKDDLRVREITPDEIAGLPDDIRLLMVRIRRASKRVMENQND